MAMMCAICTTAQVADDIYATKQQVTNENAEFVKAEKAQKTKMQRVDSLGHLISAAALESGYWVLMADRVTVGNTGCTIPALDGNSNFLFQQDRSGMVQMALNNGWEGFNGMGGMTLEGRVQNVDLRTDKKGNISYRFSLIGDDVNALVDVTIYSGSDYAQAIVTPALSGPRITLNGRLLPYRHPRY